MKRFSYYFLNYPRVVKRWWIHFLWIFFPKIFKNAFPPQTVKEWFADLFFYTVDILWVPYFYEMWFVLLKSTVRKMNEKELEEGKKMFGDSIRHDLILLDAHSRFGVGRGVMAYVTFFMINYKQRLAMPIFIHELVHIWQYQQFGSVYISKAIKAQRSKEGYDYGGIENLYTNMLKGKVITSFNFEQQAEIIEDYYRKFIEKTPSSLETNVYGYYVGMIRSTSRGEA